MNKALSLLGVAALSASLASCSGGGGSAPTPALAFVTPTPSATFAPTTAPSVAPTVAPTQAPTVAPTIAPQVYVALGDSITYGSDLPNRPVQAYPYVADANAIDLGTPSTTAITGPYWELASVPANATFITIFFGTNDFVVGETVPQYIAAMQTLIGSVKQAAPKARLVLINVPNYPPGYPNESIIPAYNTALLTLGVPVIDLYDDATYTQQLLCCSTGEHPGPGGQAEIARLVSSV